MCTYHVTSCYRPVTSVFSSDFGSFVRPQRQSLIWSFTSSAAAVLAFTTYFEVNLSQDETRFHLTCMLHLFMYVTCRLLFLLDQTADGMNHHDDSKAARWANRRSVDESCGHDSPAVWKNSHHALVSRSVSCCEEQTESKQNRKPAVISHKQDVEF